MKKIMLLVSLCLAFTLMGCSSPSNSQSYIPSTNESSTPYEDKVENINYDFLNKNNIISLPDAGFSQPTWISITQNINGTEGVFFINVSGTNIVKYGTMDGLQNKIPNGLSYEDFILAKKTSPELLKNSYPYWCKIDKELFQQYKEKLPSYLLY